MVHSCLYSMQPLPSHKLWPVPNRTRPTVQHHPVPNSTSWHLGPKREEWLFRRQERSDPSPRVPDNPNHLPLVWWNPLVTCFLCVYASVPRYRVCINLSEEANFRLVYHQLIFLTAITITNVHSQETTQETVLVLKVYAKKNAKGIGLKIKNSTQNQSIWN